MNNIPGEKLQIANLAAGLGSLIWKHRGFSLFLYIFVGGGGGGLGRGLNLYPITLFSIYMELPSYILPFLDLASEVRNLIFVGVPIGKLYVHEHIPRKLSQ